MTDAHGEALGGPALSTGVAGLDDVLMGGLPPRRMYLIQGNPGTGKTTLALQFLLAGVSRGEPTVYLTLSETREELSEIAHSHRWALTELAVLEVSSEPETTLYHPSEVELGERMATVLAEINRVRPTRVVLDSCSELRLLAQSPLRYRRQILALKQRLSALGSTILLLENPQPSLPDTILESVVHGVIALEQLMPLYGTERRRLRITKLRGLHYRGGYHDFIIRTGGLVVFPRLVASEHPWQSSAETVSSGRPQLDALLGGGPLRGTSLLLIGASGTGKSAVATQYALAAAERGERAVVFGFDESAAIFHARSRALGMEVAHHVEAGRFVFRQIDPAELSPGEFVHHVRNAVDRDGARLVVLDSLNGYLNAMPQENFVALQLHELLSYLGQKGVLSLLTVVQHGLVAQETGTPIDVSYLADSVLLFRYFEADGRVRKALSVVKKRSGVHESTIRELVLGPEGVRVGEVLAQFRGLLSGSPEYVGPPEADRLEASRDRG